MDARKTLSDDELARSIVAVIPILRAYAVVLTRSSAHADDLVQDALERAWRNRFEYRSDSGLKAWLFTILRHRFIDLARRERMTVQDVDGGNAAKLASPPEQLWRVQYSQFFKAIDKLSPEVRDPLLLVIGGGLSHQEAAQVLGCPLGTLKSRIRRARSHLLDLVEIEMPGLSREDAL